MTRFKNSQILNIQAYPRNDGTFAP